MTKFNQLVKGIIQKRNNYAKEKERNQRSFDRAWEWHAKKHYNIQARLGERMSFTEAKLGKGADHPLLCKHDHCEWWRKESVFKKFKSSVNKFEIKKMLKHLTAEQLEQAKQFIINLKKSDEEE